LLLLLCGWVVLRMSQGPAPEQPAPNAPVVIDDAAVAIDEAPLTMTQAQTLKAHSIALLENSWESDRQQLSLQEADAGFVRLAEQFPTDPLGPQNLCVTLLGRLKQTDRSLQPDRFGELSQRLLAAIEKLQTLIPNDPVAEIFTARLHLLSNNTAAAIVSYRMGAEKPQAGADILFQLYTQLSTLDDPTTTEEAGHALQRALVLAPGNLALAAEWLKFLAKTQNSEIINYVETFRTLAQPIFARHTSPLPELLDQTKLAAQEGQWPKAVLRTSGLRNVILAEIAFQHSLQMLEPHALAFVRLEFEPQTLAEFKSSSAQAISSRTVVALQMVERKLPDPEFDGVSAIASEDFDLDGHFDLWTVAGKNLRIISLAPALDREHATTADNAAKADEALSVEALCEIELAISASGLALADLDRDFQHRKDSLPASALPTATPPATEGDPQTTSTQLTHEQLIEKYLDSDLDLIVYGAEGVRFYRNDLSVDSGSRTLTEMPQAAPLSELTEVNSVAMIDFDHDADLDVAIASAQGISLWSNRGDWTFADFSSYSQLPPSSTTVTDILALDVDRNVLNDFLLAAPSSSESFVLKSNLHGRYFLQSDLWEESGFGGQASLAATDANADACWDVIGCGSAGTQLILMKSIGHQPWQPESRALLSTTPMRHVLVDDFDNDGRDDYLAWGAQGAEFFRQNAEGTIAKDDQVFSLHENTLQVATLDTDRDGDLDFISLDAQGALHLWDNVGGHADQQLELIIRADEDGKQRPRERCNMHGVGSLVELKSGDIYQCRIVRGTRTRFGLGQQHSADVLRIVWTNGIPNNVLDVSNRATIYDQQNLGGSCPYLYTWNGSRFEFCTDCLWAAPIGLQFAQGLAAPTREWEYLRIDSSYLKPRDGEYVLQMTEELWEAAYFDSIQLLAIDHPPEIEVFTNEKVGPAELAQFQVHVVRKRHAPQRVLDTTGQDISQIVAKRDGRYTKTWQQGINQGVTDEHYIELDLGELQHPEQVRLFLTGWMFPTCTSINVSMAENPLKPKSKPPSIWMPDEAGEWQEVIPYAGFPGGKTKTIVIDLSNKFPSDDYRLRVVTNMELCWDEVFFSDEPAGNESAQATRDGDAALSQQLSGSASSENELDAILSQLNESAPYRIARQSLLGADLHFRGFSRMLTQPYNAPKRYDYEQVTRASIWPPMQGGFTRYGDVTSLVRQPDDLQAVLGAGDELTMRFEASQLPLPEGWVRDFVLYNVGWDKDADLNTIQGQSVEPLPFRAMRQYPYAPQQAFPDSPAHRQFIETYQTRSQLPVEFWHQIRDYARQVQ
jgi:hypothetical protein